MKTFCMFVWSGAMGGALLLALGCATPPPPVSSLPLEKVVQFRTWTYMQGGIIEAAWDSYKNGMVSVILSNGETRDIDVNRLSAGDQQYVQEELRKPRGLINDVLVIAWREGRPHFSVSASFFPQGDITAGPFVYLQYVFKDTGGGIHHRACDPMALYPVQGRFDYQKMTTTVVKECWGTNETACIPAGMLALRAVMLLPAANRSYAVLDVFANQNVDTLKRHGISPFWWREMAMERNQR